MTVNERITKALDAFGDPVQHGEHLTTEGDPRPERHYTFNYSTHGADYRDNAPVYDKHLVMVHLYCPRTYNAVARVKQTRQALFKAGFTWPSVVNASDAGGQHIVFECEAVEEVVFDG